jgi:hypothetical protein
MDRTMHELAAEFDRISERYRAGTVDMHCHRDLHRAFEKVDELGVADMLGIRPGGLTGRARGLIERRLFDAERKRTADHMRAAAFTEMSERLRGIRPPLRAELAAREPVAVGILACLAHSLPAAERSRFVAEALGNLGDCEHRWQRVDHLVCLAFGMPRLGWMMRRGGRRGRA